MQRILIASSGIFHPPYLGRRELAACLSVMEGCEIHSISSLENLPEHLGDFSAIVIYLHHKAISDSSLTALEDFVSNGGGLLGLHSASASFKQQPRYFSILGGRFTGHGPITEFETRQTSGSVFAPSQPFTIKDELYLHDLQPGAETHFSTLHAGQEVPVVWTHRFGKGRVCFSSPGHTAASLRHPALQSILRQGLNWVAR